MFSIFRLARQGISSQKKRFETQTKTEPHIKNNLSFVSFFKFTHGPRNSTRTNQQRKRAAQGTRTKTSTGRCSYVVDVKRRDAKIVERVEIVERFDAHNSVAVIASTSRAEPVSSSRIAAVLWPATAAVP